MTDPFPPVLTPRNGASPSPEMATLTGGGALIHMLSAHGVRHVYGLASGKLGPIFRALAETPELDYVGVRHEATAAFMATAIAARTGRIALCLGETGPGGLNLLSGLGGAFANNLPVLAVTSSNPSALTTPDLGAFATSDNHRLFAPITKSSAFVSDIAQLPALVRAALAMAVQGRPGPVHLDLPAEILAQSHRFPAAELEAPLHPTPPDLPDHRRVVEAARLLAVARRPLVLGGGGMLHGNGPALFRALVARAGCPVVTTQMGLGLLPDDDPQLAGQGGIIGGPAVLRALREADVILSLGCRLSSWMWADGPYDWKPESAQRVIQVDIDPQMIGRVRPATLGFVCDAAQFAERFAAVLPPSQADEAWLPALVAERARHRAALGALAAAPGTSTEMHPATLARVVGQAIGRDGLCVFDGGHTTFWSNDFTPTAAPRTRFHEPGMTHLGFGLPWAIALKRSEPEQAVWCITGDGAFGFTLQELDTARREGVAIIVVVHNNGGFGVIAHSQARSGFTMGTDLSGTDYAAIARGFGCFGVRVETVDDLHRALADAVRSGLPAVIDARVRFDPHPMMAAFGRSTASPATEDPS